MILDVLLSSLFAFAPDNSVQNRLLGNEVGNGGDVVICPSADGLSIAVLDYFEARKMMPQLPLDLVGGNAAELIDRALTRLERVDPIRAKRYRDHAIELLSGSDSYFLSGLELRDINDSGYVPLGDCKIQQAVIQREPWHPLDRRFTFDGDLWSRLPVGDQAGLILHEVIYREVLELGQRNSTSVRQLVAWLSSPLFEQVSQEQYDENIRPAVFFVPRLLAFKQERVQMYVERGGAAEMNLAQFLAKDGEAEIEWRIDELGAKAFSIDPRTGAIRVLATENSSSTLRTSVTATSGILWDVVPVDAIVINRGEYPPRWLADEFTIRLTESATGKVFELQSVVAVPSGEFVRFRMVSGPRGVHISENGVVTVDAGFNGRSLIEVAVNSQSGWAQTSFFVERT
jgi:hypothetical protein